MLSFVPPSRRSLLRESRFALIAPLAALVAYFPAIVVPYGFMDDYYLLAWQRGLEGEFWKTATQFGRPLHALFLSGAFGLASDIGALRLVRLLGLLGVMLLALLLYYVLRQAGFGRWLSTGVCVSVVSLASFQLYVSWAAIFEAPYVAVLAGLASLRLRSASAWKVGVRSSVGARPPRFFSARCSAISLPRCSSGSSPRSTSYARTRSLLGRCGSSAKALRWQRWRCSSATQRCESACTSTEVRSRVGRTSYTISSERRGGSGTSRSSTASGCSISSRPRARLSRSRSSQRSGSCSSTASPGPGALGFLGLAVAFVPLSYTPNLVISENFASYRSTAALATLLTLYLWFGLWGIARALTSSAREARRPIVTRVFVLALAALASFAALALVAVPLRRPLERVSIHTLTSAPELAAFALLFIVFAGTALWATGDSGRRTFGYGRGRSGDDRVRVRRRTDRSEERHNTRRETAERGSAAGAIGAQQRIRQPARTASCSSSRPIPKAQRRSCATTSSDLPRRTSPGSRVPRPGSSCASGCRERIPLSRSLPGTRLRHRRPRRATRSWTCGSWKSAASGGASGRSTQPRVLRQRRTHLPCDDRDDVEQIHGRL